MLPSRAMTSPPPAPERQVVKARLRKETKSPVCTSEDLSDDSQHVEKRHRRTLKVTESYRVHLEPTGQPLQGWQLRAVRGQARDERSTLQGGHTGLEVHYQGSGNGPCTAPYTSAEHEPTALESWASTQRSRTHAVTNAQRGFRQQARSSISITLTHSP
ncbi:hypothetical protein CYMTET_19858 [Cymbomonas tetramitiformis]|uniref:Uncharacterized protein n=1 Tax=Cymbomonas tetramitiformis TaxID=36881 RepID=A0AAE0L4G6_9CHLO|nr:hypothetical protein CYMTET_19858 [Cymbomonas tetramitiformis]